MAELQLKDVADDIHTMFLGDEHCGVVSVYKVKAVKSEMQVLKILLLENFRSQVFSCIRCIYHTHCPVSVFLPHQP